MLVTIQSVLHDPLGLMGWLFIGGYAVVAVFLTLVILGAIALVKRVGHMRGQTVDGA